MCISASVWAVHSIWSWSKYTTAKLLDCDMMLWYYLGCQRYKPLIWGRGRCPHQVRPQSKESKGEDTRKKEKMTEKITDNSVFSLNKLKPPKNISQSVFWFNYAFREKSQKCIISHQVHAKKLAAIKKLLHFLGCKVHMNLCCPFCSWTKNYDRNKQD